ncbi:MAG: LamG-like jellyroll fold domain-containing protein [Planctomycetota bacterium]
MCARFSSAAFGALVAVAVLLPGKALAVEYVIHISVDAMHAGAVSALDPAAAPNFYRLLNEGAATFDARTDFNRTNTSPNHATIFTGRPVFDWTRTDGSTIEGHLWGENATDDPTYSYTGSAGPNNITLHDVHTAITSPVFTQGGDNYTSTGGNTPEKTAYEYVHSVLDVAHDAGLRTGMYYGKHRINMEVNSYDSDSGAPDLNPLGGDNGANKVDSFLYQPDTQTAALISAWKTDMQADPFNYSFIHFSRPDHVGHPRTWDLTPGSDYQQSIQLVDGYLGEILELIETDPRFKDNTAIVLTTDHGGRLGTGTHDPATWQDNYQIPFMVWGPGVAAGADLYQLNPQYLTPGEGRPDYQDPYGQPIRNGDSPNLVLSLLGLSAIPNSSMNADQRMALSYNYAGMVAADQPVRHWRLNESGATTAAVNSATNTTATPAEADGVYVVSPVQSVPGLLATQPGATAVRFEGAQRIDIPTHADVDSDGNGTVDFAYAEKTIELWFNADGTSERQVLYDQGGQLRGLNVYLVGGKLYMSGWNTTNETGSPAAPWGGEGPLARAVSADVTAGETHHAVLVMNGDPSGTEGSITGFLDGRPIGQIYGVGLLFEHDGLTAVGGQSSEGFFHDTGPSLATGYNFIGTIGEVSQYNAALGTERVQLHTIHGTGQRLSHGAYGDAVLGDSPLAYYQLGEQSGDGAVNVSTSATGAGLGAALDARHQGGIAYVGSLLPQSDNGAVGFTGAGSGSMLPGNAAMDDAAIVERTVSLWFKADSVTGRQVLFEEGGEDHGLNLYIEGGQLHASAWNDSGTSQYLDLGTPITAGETHHVALTYDDTADAMVTMLDGQVVAAQKGIASILPRAAGTGLGVVNGGTRFADGSATGAGESHVDRSFAGVMDDVAIFGNGLTVNQVRRQLAAAGFAAAQDPYEAAVQADAPSVYYRMDNTAGNGFANVAGGFDSVGHLVTGRANGTGVSRTAASLVGAATPDSAAVLTGTGLIALPDNGAINQQKFGHRTIELWFNAADAAASGRQVLYEHGDGANGMNVYLEGGQVRLGAWSTNTDTGTVTAKFAVSPTIESGENYHLAFAFDDVDSNGMFGYLNGVLIGHSSGTVVINGSGGDIGLGGRNQATRYADGSTTGVIVTGTGDYFRGQIDEVAIYPRPFTIAQAQSHYAAATGYRFGLPDVAKLGVTLNYDAAMDTDGNSTWEDCVGSVQSDGSGNHVEFALGGATRQAVTSACLGITHAYDFTAGAKGTAASLEKLMGNPTDTGATFEFWFKPHDLMGDEMIFETGGATDGTALLLQDSMLRFSTWDNQGATNPAISTSTFDLSLLTAGELGEFLHVVAEVDLVGDMSRLFVNGELRDEQAASANIADWAGSDNTGLAGVNGGTLGGLSTGTFDGQIAVFRFYDMALTAGEVRGNYLSVVPEPGMFTLAAISLAVLALSRRRKRSG